MDDHGPRISRLDWHGTPAWLKRQEVLSFRYRLQKGDPQKLFAAERATYRKLAMLGLPGPDVLKEAPDFLVIKDAGPTLQDILRKQDQDPEVTNDALMRSALALADLHNNGVAHGRPAPRDICLQDGRITFLDWERHKDRRNTPKGFSNDVVIWAYFTIATVGDVPPGLRPACLAYLDAGPLSVRAEICTRTRRLSVVQALLTPLLNAYQHKPDIAAVGPTLRFLREGICKRQG